MVAAVSWGMNLSPCCASWLLIALAAALAGCGRTISTADAAADGGEESPKGDQTVFSDIDVHVAVAGFDNVDFDARDASGAPFPEPPIHVRASVIIEINGAMSEGRVPELRVFGDGAELEEIGSAGWPQRFSFQHGLDAAAHGQRLDLGFRYAASEFTLSVWPPVIELTRPAADEAVSSVEPLSLEWTGTEAALGTVLISPRGQTCAVGYRKSGETTFVPERRDTGAEPPCRFELSADWQVDIPEPQSPFRSLQVAGRTRRIQRFNVQ